jgi:hypothetical protein
MAELCESVAFGEVSEQDHSCPFCKEKSQVERKNDLVNDSANLASSLKNAGKPEPDWVIKYIHPLAGELDGRLRTNAHHLIPGDASLNPHPKIKKYITAGNTVDADIGYGVNHQNNGVWLPSYPHDFETLKDKEAPVKWSEMTKVYPDQQFDIAVQAMEKAQHQFHDAHPDYSDFASQCLDKICEKLLNSGCQCPNAKKKGKPWPAPFALVGRLDGISGRLRNLLSGLKYNWKDPVFTSRHAKQWAKVK